MMNIWVTPVPYKGNDEVTGPTPEKAGLIEGQEYLVVDFEGNCNPDYDKEAFVGVINREGELWYISNRHLRFTKVRGIQVSHTSNFGQE
jgi:Golgi nucleoside diphosphatase